MGNTVSRIAQNLDASGIVPGGMAPAKKNTRTHALLASVQPPTVNPTATVKPSPATPQTASKKWSAIIGNGFTSLAAGVAAVAAAIQSISSLRFGIVGRHLPAFGTSLLFAGLTYASYKVAQHCYNNVKNIKI